MEDEEPTNPLVKEVPGHLFKFEEKIWGMSIQQLMTDLAIFTGSFALFGSLSFIAHIMLSVTITLCAAILVHGKVQGNSLGFWLFLSLRAKTIPTFTQWEAPSTRQPGQKRIKQRASVQRTWVPVETLEQGVMGKCRRQNNRLLRYWMAFEVEGRTIQFLPEQDQIRIYRRFESFLTGLEFHIQFLSYTEPMNPQTAPALLAQKEALASLTPKVKALQKASIRIQEKQMPSCSKIRHFVIIGASAAEASLRNPDGTPRSVLSTLWNTLTFKKAPEISQAQILDQLHIRASIIRKAIQKLDMRITPLKDCELLQLFAHSLAPGVAQPTFAPELIPGGPLPLRTNEGEERKSPKLDHAERAPAHTIAQSPSAGDKRVKTSLSSLSQQTSDTSCTPESQKKRGDKRGQLPKNRHQKRIGGMHGIFYYKSNNEQVRFEAGILSLADLLAPSSVQIRPNVIEICARGQKRYVRSFTITGYGHHLLCGWMNNLHELGLPMLISSHFEPIDSQQMLMKLEHSLATIDSRRLDDQKAIRETKADHTIESQQIRRVVKALASKQLKIFNVSVTICLHAGSLERLEQRSRFLRSHLRDMQIQIQPTQLQQDLAWQSSLPINLDILQNWVMLPSDVGSTFLVGTNGNIGSPTGVLLGYTGSGLSSRPVYYDPWKLPNPHIVCIGETGMGKSWLAKTIATGFLGLGLADVAVLDKADDYLALHEELGSESQRYDLARSCPINFFDIPFGPTDIDPNDPADILEEFFANDLLTGETLLITDGETQLSKGEEAFLISVNRLTYADAGITSEAIRQHPETLLRPAPTLADFIAKMKAVPASSESMRQSLLERLEKAAYLFQSGQTSISLEKPLTIFSIKELDERWYPLMTYVVQNFLMRHRAVKRDERYLAYIVEEASYLLKHPAGRRYLERGSRGFRKLGIAQVTLSQNPQDFLDAGQVVLSNAGTVIYLGMHQQAAEKLQLPSEELVRALTEEVPGQCVMRCGNEYAQLQVWSNPVYKTLFTTDPAEQKELRLKKEQQRPKQQEK